MSTAHKVKRIFIIAGEASGDTIGAHLMAALKRLAPTAEIHGIGGAKMEAQGLRSLFPMTELSLMGFIEIVPHIPKLLYRIRQTVAHIRRVQPDVIVTIDSPGFNFKIAKKLKNMSDKTPRIHYVAPSVWAYKPERAEKVAALFDHQLMILPFEPPYFDAVGIKNSYVGHPIVEEPIAAPSFDFREKYHIAANAPLLCMTAGSRHTELKRLLPVYKQVIAQLVEKFPTLHVVTPTMEHLQTTLSHWAQDVAAPVTITTDMDDKYAAYHTANAGLAKSGTNTLEMSLAGLPIVMVYKMHPFSYWWIKRLVKIRFVNLLNLVMDKEIIPECIQENCIPEVLTTQLSLLLEGKNAASAQKKNVKKALTRLGLDQKECPSDKAAKVVMAACGG